MRYADCHTNRKHYCNGVCKPCYNLSRRKTEPRKVTCHPDRQHEALGLCQQCYLQQDSKRAWRKAYYQRNRERLLAKGRAYQNAHKSERSERERRRRVANRDKFREADLIKNYNMTLTQYNEMCDAQGEVCKICRLKCSRALSVDHCHSTGKVRGLLCLKCNTGLGSFGDNPDRLKSAAAYLQDYL